MGLKYTILFYEIGDSLLIWLLVIIESVKIKKAGSRLKLAAQFFYHFTTL